VPGLLCLILKKSLKNTLSMHQISTKQVHSLAQKPCAAAHLVRSHFVTEKYRFSPGCEKCRLNGEIAMRSDSWDDRRHPLD